MKIDTADIRFARKRWAADALLSRLPVLFGITILSSACLLFLVQPLISKLILPWFGGSAAVWITCLLFFQAGLLLGYLYAHGLTRAFGPKRQGAATHGAAGCEPRGSADSSQCKVGASNLARIQPGVSSACLPPPLACRIFCFLRRLRCFRPGTRGPARLCVNRPLPFVFCALERRFACRSAGLSNLH